MATLSISSHELNIHFLSHLLYASVSILIASYLSAYCTLVDSGTTINLVHKSIISFLGLTVEPHPGFLVTLADGKKVLSYSSYVSLLYIIAGVSYSGSFFVALLRAQLLIFDMPYLKWENPVIDWQSKTLISLSNPLSNPSLNLSSTPLTLEPPTLPDPFKLPDPFHSFDRSLKHHLSRILSTR